jgi:hypothetical protein
VLQHVSFEIFFFVKHHEDELDLTDPLRQLTVSPVLIIGYLLGFLDNLDLYLLSTLSEACKTLHTCSGHKHPRQGFDIYNYDFLRSTGVIRLVGAQKSGGMTCKTAILVVPRRKHRDKVWIGDMLKLHLLHLPITRACSRLCISIEDLREKTPEREMHACSPPMSSDKQKQRYWEKIVDLASGLLTTFFGSRSA